MAGRDIPTFADAAGVADLIMQNGVEHDSISIMYNKFLLAISYELAIVEVANEKIPKESHQSLHSPSSWLTIYQQDSMLTSAKHFVLDSSGQSHTDPQSPQLSPFWTGLSRHTFSVGSCPALPRYMLKQYLHAQGKCYIQLTCC